MRLVRPSSDVTVTMIQRLRHDDETRIRTGLRHRHRVLVVDDFPDSADAICALLDVFGQHCRSAYSGRAALAEAHGFSPDVVILDLGLPDLDGYQVARSLRAQRVSTRLHIVALTGWGHPVKRRLALEAGCDQFTVKPCGAATLRAILHEVDRRTA